MARRSYLELCDKAAYNGGSEAAPPFAVLQVTNWTEDFNGNDLFTFKKPDGKGKFYLINGPFAIPAGGSGPATNHDGAWVLYEGDLPSSSAELPEWGPKSGSWAIKTDGKGFAIVGNVKGSPASLPGLPPTASTARVRVKMVTVAKVTNRIQGTVASTVTEQTQQFLINKIFVLSGVDPRPEPVNPIQTVVVQNNLQKAYVNGVDRVTATQNESDGLWYVETATGEADSIYFELIEDKKYTDTTRKANPVLADGTIDGPTEITVTDERKKFWGLKATSTELGYRGLGSKRPTAFIASKKWKARQPS
jgi:hypothetical protein